MELGKERDQHSEKVTAEKTSSSVPMDEKHTYIRSLRVFTGRYSDAPIWKIMLRPVVMWFYPAVLWAFLIYGKLILVLLPLVRNACTRLQDAKEISETRNNHHLGRCLFCRKWSHFRGSTL